MSDTSTDRMALAAEAVEALKKALTDAGVNDSYVRADIIGSFCNRMNDCLAASPLQAAGAAEPTTAAYEAMKRDRDMFEHEAFLLRQMLKAHPQPAPAGDAGALADVLTKLIPLSEALLAGRQPSADLEEHRALRNFLPTARAALAQ